MIENSIEMTNELKKSTLLGLHPKKLVKYDIKQT